jgi:hypothetical protein
VRALFSLRTLAAVVALALLVVVLRQLIPDSGPVEEDAAQGKVHHRVDLIVPVAEAVPAAGFTVDIDGRTTADLALVIDAQRTMFIAAGTPGEVTCPAVPTSGCAVAVDLLGEAVLWFALVEREAGKNLALPATVELLEDGHVVLANGWEVPHAYKVERRCADDTASLTAFIERFGDTSTTTFDFEAQEVVQVTCP